MKKSWLIAGAVMGCLAGASLGACGNGGTGGTGGSGGTTTATGPSTTTTTTTGMTTTTATGTTTSTTTTTTGTGGMGTGTGGSSGTGMDAGTCGKVTTLHPPMPGTKLTLYCPFSGVDGGKAVDCDPSIEHCCETPAMSTTPSACHTNATPCGATDVDWQCEDPGSDCTGGMDCCATSKPGKISSIGLGAPGCGNFAHQMIGTKCMAAGSCPGIKMCTADTECTSPQKCTPFGKAGNQVGGCM